MPFSEKVKNLIKNAWDDGYVCLLASTGVDGPNVSPKGSMMIFDDQHLADWERSKKKAFENVKTDNRVCVIYSNMEAQRDGRLDSGILRFYGRAELHAQGAVRDAIFACLNHREQTHDGADVGVGVLIRIERAADVRGKPIE